MIPVCPNRPAKSVRAIESTRHSDHETAKATRQRYLIACFANEMHVVALNTKMDDSASKPITGSSERGNEGTP